VLSSVVSAVDWPNVFVLVIGIFSWAGIHGALVDKDITISQSRVVVIEFAPAFSFAGLVVYTALPAASVFLFGTVPGYTDGGGLFDTLSRMIGAVSLTIATVGWIALIPDKDEATEGPERSG
jgi:hypothetical protein